MDRNRTSDTRIFSPLLYQLSYQGMDCGDRIWTCDLRVMSPTSFQAALPRAIYIINTKDGGRWIRTTEGEASRFTVCPLWPLGNSPIKNTIVLKERSSYFHKKADNRTRTDNLLITNQLLCQLSYIGINSIQIVLLSIPVR